MLRPEAPAPLTAENARKSCSNAPPALQITSHLRVAASQLAKQTFPQPCGKYVLVEKVAMGGMAEIFRAKTIGAEGFEREVAIKRILPHFCEDENFVRMFIDEATIAAKLHHANIVQIFDFHKIDDAYYIAMEFIDGRDFKKLLERTRDSRDKIGVWQAVFVATEIAKALHYAHTRTHKGRPLNIVHRDYQSKQEP